MLEQLFGSKTRSKLLNFFLRNSQKEYYVRELARFVGCFLNGVRRELEKLEKLQILKSKAKDRRKYYKLNPDFFLYKELKSLFLKSAVIFENRLVDELRHLGDLDYVAFSGFFTGTKTETDLLLVGNKINKAQLRKILKQFGQEFGHEIRYTIMLSEEFKYRREIKDGFLSGIVDNKKIEVINKIK